MPNNEVQGAYIEIASPSKREVDGCFTSAMKGRRNWVQGGWLQLQSHQSSLFFVFAIYY